MDTPKRPEKNPPPSETPGQDAPEKQTPENEPRRYDEADPNWRNPDVQMKNPGSAGNTNVNTPHGRIY